MEWISVKDRLPEKTDNYSTWCLVYMVGNGIVCRPFDHYHYCWNDEQDDDFECTPTGDKITHWMPLTEPPKESHD